MATETSMRDLHLSRRRLFAGAAALGLGGAFLRSGATPARAAPQDTKHLVWVWQFTTDAEPNLVGARLLEHGLGIVLKTHDGLQWMSQYDKSPFAVSGPAQVRVLADYYETAGVPFHTWNVVQGVDPVREAQMTAAVLEAGARSVFLDLEPYAGFWRGTPADAEAYGRELRRLSPDGQVILSIDARPWIIERLPLKQFAAFADGIAPQQYWRTFNTQANFDRYSQSGYPVGPEGVTPEFLIQTTEKVLAPFGLPISHTGQGATPDANEWNRFLDLAYGAGSSIVSVWRYGVTNADVFSLLRDRPPPQPVLAIAADGTYVVQSGDTLGAIAAAQGVSLQSIVEANGLTDVNYLYVGQELKIQGGSGGGGAAAAGPSTSQVAGERSYTVVDGDTLYGIAGKFGTTPDAIASASGISDIHFLSIGQVLKIP
jgi:LysM repeat protein